MAEIKTTLQDTAILLFNLAKARGYAQVGFEDANRTYHQLVHSLERASMFNIEVVESALWAANLLSEEGKFEHPDGLTFDEFVTKMLSLTKYKFDRTYNTLEIKHATKTRRT